MLFRGWIIFKQYVLKKHRQLDYELHMCIQAERKDVTLSVTVPDAMVTGLTARTGGTRCILYLDSSCPALFADLHAVTIDCYGTSRPYKIVMAEEFQIDIGTKTGYVKTRVSSFYIYRG